jgi:hypothetical protein
MPKKLGTTLYMKEGLTYLMVTRAYHLPYFGLLECDEPWLIQQMRGVAGMPSVDVLIIIIMV